MLRHGFCRSFTGIQHRVCALGIRYDDFAGVAYPCFPSEPNDTRARGRCAGMDLPTVREVEDDEQRVRAEVRQYFAQYAERQRYGLCGQCGTPATAHVQVGRCLYVEPCGCRLGQGQLTHEGRRVDRLEITPQAQEEQ